MNKQFWRAKVQSFSSNRYSLHLAWNTQPTNAATLCFLIPYAAQQSQSANMNLTPEVPDELARSLEEIAATQHMSIQQLALDRLRSLVPADTEFQSGSAAALLRNAGVAYSRF